MGALEELLGLISSIGKDITDTSNWTLTVETPYVLGVHGAQSPATVDTVSTPGDASLEIAFTFFGTQYTVQANAGGADAAVSINGTSEPKARLVTAGLDPINADFRPVTLPGSTTVVRLNFKFDDV